jgi:hypothetical protein
MGVGPFHELMIDELKEQSTGPGISVKTQYRTWDGKKLGYVDLVIESKEKKLLIEVEMTARRIFLDVAKFNAISSESNKPTYLWIVTPTAGLRDRIEARLKNENKKEICVLTYGHALQRVRDFVSVSLVHTKSD